MISAVQAAVMCNALGVLICDWSLPGHVNPLTVSIPALLAGAGFAWKASTDVVSLFRSSFFGILNCMTLERTISGAPNVSQRLQQREL